MADMVASALAQEGVSRASTFISTKLEDKASTAHNMARLEMALSRLEYALERAGKMPITYVSLLRRVKMLKIAYAEGTDLLNKHKLRLLQLQDKEEQAMQGGSHDATGRAVVTRYNPLLEWIGRATKKFRISSLLGLSEDYLSSVDVQKFELYVDFADKFVADVETGCPLGGRGTFRYPFVRQLLEGETIWFGRIRGSQRMYFHMLPLRSDDRGVEAELCYFYEDLRAADNSFHVRLVLRLSECTDIVGTAIKCLKLQTSQLKLEIESAIIGELMLLTNLQAISHSYVPPWICIQDTTFLHRGGKYLRPDPICCNGNGARALASSIAYPEPSNQVPEPVIAISFGCCISAPEYKPRNTNTPTPPLYFIATSVPHFASGGHQPEFMLMYSDKRENKSGSMQQMEEIVGSNALDYLVLEPEATNYDIFWWSAHGAAAVFLRKSSNEKAQPQPTPVSGSARSDAKRKR